ncbi:hypothetical protein [Pseudoalteromonas lipolytica]|uniref:hypothetical protein n=1 Tax=Pseudoalteromonas lipolytica TaxID=570156 RepID=UPI003A97510B
MAFLEGRCYECTRNYLLSLQINCYNTSVTQIIDVQNRIFRSLLSGSHYAEALLVALDISHYSTPQQHQALLKQVLHHLATVSVLSGNDMMYCLLNTRLAYTLHLA